MCGHVFWFKISYKENKNGISHVIRELYQLNYSKHVILMYFKMNYVMIMYIYFDKFFLLSFIHFKKSTTFLFVVSMGCCLISTAIADEVDIAPSLENYRNPRFIKLFGVSIRLSWRFIMILIRVYITTNL